MPTVTDLLPRAKTVADNGGLTADSLRGYINEALADMSQVAGVIAQKTVVTTAEAQAYDLPADYISLIGLTVDGKQPTSVREARFDPAAGEAWPYDTPGYDIKLGKVYLYRKTPAVGSLVIDYEGEIPPLTTNSQAPQFPARWHYNLLNFVGWKARQEERDKPDERDDYRQAWFSFLAAWADYAKKHRESGAENEGLILKTNW